MKLKNTSIKWKLFIYIALFGAAMIFIIWLFQIVFLNAFYRQTKISEIKTLAKTINENVDNNDLSTLVTELASQSNICARVINTTTNIEINANTVPKCLLHRMTDQDLSQLYTQAKQNGGSYFENFTEEDFNVLNIQSEYGQGKGIIPKKEFERDENIIYTQIVNSSQGSQYVVMLNTKISPVNATVQTLRSQLFYISLLFMALALVFALILSKKVSNPIIKINDSAKELAKGSVDVHFEGEGYREITELSDTLNYASAELAKVEHLRRELIANVSHDLRTPLTMITGYAEVMRDIPGENTPENVQIIIDEANRLTHLVNDMLDISKLQSGVQILSESDYDLTASIRSILSRYTKLTEQNDLHIQFEADRDIFVRADEIKIAQVIYNLVNNAINYVGDDKTVIIRQHIIEDRVRIEVIDHGEGIEADLLPYVWDRYYKIDKAHKQASVGTGLGLSIVRNVMKLHHFNHGVKSVPGKGSNFWFEMKILPKEVEKN